MLDRETVGSKWELIPNRETVTVTFNRMAGPTEIEVTDAWEKHPKNAAKQFSGVELHGNETLWCVPNELLNPGGETREIRMDDEIESAGGTFLVLAAQLVSLKSRWECLCNRTDTP